METLPNVSNTTLHPEPNRLGVCNYSAAFVLLAVNSFISVTSVKECVTVSIRVGVECVWFACVCTSLHCWYLDAPFKSLDLSEVFALRFKKESF